MTRAVVAVLKTSPGTMTDDYRRLLDFIETADALDKRADTVLAADLHWHHFAPACNTPPWQIDGVVKGLIASGFDPGRMVASINGATGLSVRHGEVLNRQRLAAERNGLAIIHPGTDEPFVLIHPAAKLRVLDRIYPGGVPVPARFPGANAVLLPVMRTHAELTVAGALFSGFSATLNHRRSRIQSQFAEALVDVLAIQREIHPGMIAVADGAFAGQGPDPRRLMPVETNLIAASPDPVALDSVIARLMGFDPMAIPALRIAADAGLGICNPQEIELRGDNIESVNMQFSTGNADGLLSQLRRVLFSGLADRLSMAYHDWYWYTHHTEKDVSKFMKSGWGKLFEEYRK